MVFVELPIFARCAAHLFSDDDLAEMQSILLDNPAAGDVIPGGRGLRKLRVAMPGRGKRGGARIIHYHIKRGVTWFMPIPRTRRPILREINGIDWRH